MASPRTLTPIPAPRSAPSPRQRRGRSKARAPSARKPCLLFPRGEGRVQSLLDADMSRKALFPNRFIAISAAATPQPVKCAGGCLSFARSFKPRPA
ncbi:hypothetical protein CEX93_16525 [Xanthomonas euvesicatoria]|nr:hypothetical protein CEX93_16525 [Xanthomonas euvesicatoria]